MVLLAFPVRFLARAFASPGDAQPFKLGFGVVVLPGDVVVVAGVVIVVAGFVAAAAVISLTGACSLGRLHKRTADRGSTGSPGEPAVSAP